MYTKAFPEGAELPVYVYSSAATMALVPALVDTVISTVPVEPAGAVHVISVADTTTTAVADTVPNLTTAPETKFVPVIVTVSPAEFKELFGETAETVGMVADAV
jgi:hypothetical protein